MERLSESGEEESVLQNHAAYFVEFAETAEPYLTSGQRDSWLRKLEAEIDNIRMVLSHSLKCRIDPIFGIRLAGTLGWFWHLRGYLTEGRNWASSLMKLPEASERTRARAKVLFPAGGLAWSQGDYRIGNAILKESASIFKEVGDLRGLTDARGILAGGLASLGEYDKAQALCEDTVALLRQSGDRWGLAFILYWLGSIILVKTGDTKAVRVMFEEILALSKELQDSWLHAEALNHLGVVNGMQGDYEVAQSYFEASIAYHETTGDRWAIARSLSGFGEVMLRQGNYDGAKS
ncbi:MAG: tetratricopeptide repeat protein, partial [candidate division Zixibacteria bacterium]|nr:tetratricopeptide repeat protein [candidate division KSB1 bacterium]NIR64296.1 tetratricopeptide repeat protein [candidate division Zixibacteria bacterium]NIW45163.1 tetratricopeptide repeat protein [Gammaproteobacteria bacterium]NIS46199.1 tetratricopeptide repeat protein [candidate division Zixibacteria bacterium]NIT71449.1 tetratricopeptide repeat protein [candidate division KSB1 bacterium]